MDSAELEKEVECRAPTAVEQSTVIEREIDDPFGLGSIWPTGQPPSEIEEDLIRSEHSGTDQGSRGSIHRRIRKTDL
jgi:hypothetical protein